MSRQESSTLNNYNSPVNFDELGLEIGIPENGIVPIKVGATGQTIKIRQETPADNVLRIIEGHVRAVRRSKAPGMPGLRPIAPALVAPGSTPATSLAGSPVSSFLSHAATSLGLTDPVGNVGNIVNRLRADPKSFIQSLASPQNLPPTEDVRIPVSPVRNAQGAMIPSPGSTPLQPAEPATFVESIPIIGPIFTAARTSIESGDVAGGMGELAPLFPAAAAAARGVARGALAAGRSLESGGTVLESARAGAGAMPSAPAPAQPRVMRVGNTDVPLMLDEMSTTGRPGLTEVFGRLGGQSRPVREFNQAREDLLESAIRQETRQMAPPGGAMRTLDGREIDATVKTGLPSPSPERIGVGEFDKMSPLAIREVAASLDKVSYDRLVQKFFSQMIEDSMKPGVRGAGPVLDAEKLVQRIDSLPKENVEAMLGKGIGTGNTGVPTKVSASMVLSNMRDMADMMQELQQNGSLVGKIERLHVAGYRRFGPMFLYLQDATGLIGLNHLAGLVLTHPDLMIKFKSFLKATPGTAAELAAGEGVLENAMERNYQTEKGQTATDIRRPLLADRAPKENEAVLSDLVEAVTGDPRLFQSVMDQADNILYGGNQREKIARDLGIKPEDVKVGEMPFGPGEGGEMLRKVAVRVFKPGSLGEAFGKLAATIRHIGIPLAGGDPKITMDVIRSKVPEEVIQKTGVLDWLQVKVDSGAKIWKSEIEQLIKNLKYKAKDASPAEFEMVVQPAGTAKAAVVGTPEQVRAAEEAGKNKAAVDLITREVVKGKGFEDYKIKSIEELAAIPGRPAWIEAPGGGRQYLPALDHRVLVEEKNWRRMLFQAKSDIDQGYDQKTPEQIRKAEDTMVRVLAKYRKWEQEIARKYKEIRVGPPINIKTGTTQIGTTQIRQLPTEGLPEPPVPEE